MTDRCSSFWGKHTLEVAFWGNGPLYIKCTVCGRHWEQDLHQSVPVGYKSWKERDQKKEAEYAKMSMQTFAHLAAHTVSTERRGQDLEAEIAAPLLLEHIIKYRNIKPADAELFRLLAKEDPQRIIDMINGH
ncbi:MAG: hypothetical protein ACD_61C00116G0007 [uncultured bacterium]|nr:MAG: hypothetical protein ACD_61C00116G0007 [uncultured bacterium]